MKTRKRFRLDVYLVFWWLRRIWLGTADEELTEGYKQLENTKRTHKKPNRNTMYCHSYNDGWNVKKDEDEIHEVASANHQALNQELCRASTAASVPTITGRGCCWDHFRVRFLHRCLLHRPSRAAWFSQAPRTPRTDPCSTPDDDLPSNPCFLHPPVDTNKNAIKI